LEERNPPSRLRREKPELYFHLKEEAFEVLEQEVNLEK
jgi:hypothetical protein